MHALQNSVYKTLKFSLFFILSTSSLKQEIQDGLTRLNAAPSLFNSLDNYGCWCTLNSNWQSASGKVQNEIDSECRKLVKGYRCAKSDFDFDFCDPYLISYNEFDVQPESTVADMVEFCKTNNAGSDCAINTCVMDGNFIQKMAVLLETDYFDELVHDTVGGVFNQFDICTNNGIPGEANGPIFRECCGLYRALELNNLTLANFFNLDF